MLKTPLLVIILAAFLITSVVGPLPQAMANDFHLPAPGVMIHLSPPLDPPILKGIKVRTDNPFRFDFILDKGESPLSNDALKEESSKLIKYFLASLTIPEKDLWVNLSPYEKDRIIPNSFGLTEMGRDLLAEDYMLKQITASLIYPEDEIGKRFWKRIYEEAEKKFGTTNIPVNTFNKVWIVPEKAVVYENAKAGTAYVIESKLKVMLEQDYLSLEKHNAIMSHSTVMPAKAGIQDTSALGSQIVREIVIPELTREVNEDKNFSQLRQVYNSLILATWYKKKIKDSILEQVYSDQNKVAGVNIDDPQEKEKIYQRYLKAFKKGVYNYIKEEIDPVTQEIIPRKYFSGGFNMAMAANNILKITEVFSSQAMIPPDRAEIIKEVTVLASPIGSAGNQAMNAGELNSEIKILKRYGIKPGVLIKARIYGWREVEEDYFSENDLRMAIEKAQRNNDSQAIQVITQWEQTKNFAGLHGNLVQDQSTGKVGILVGTSGAGKSKISYFLSKLNFKVLADDSIVLFHQSDGRLLAMNGDLSASRRNLREGEMPLEVQETQAPLPVEFMIYLRERNSPHRTVKEYVEHVLGTLVVDPRNFNEYLNSIAKIPERPYDRLERSEISDGQLQKESEKIKKWVNNIGNGPPSAKGKNRAMSARLLLDAALQNRAMIIKQDLWNTFNENTKTALIKAGYGESNFDKFDDKLGVYVIPDHVMTIFCTLTGNPNGGAFNLRGHIGLDQSTVEEIDHGKTDQERLKALHRLWHERAHTEYYKAHPDFNPRNIEELLVNEIYAHLAGYMEVYGKESMFEKRESEPEWGQQDWFENIFLGLDNDYLKKNPEQRKGIVNRLGYAIQIIKNYFRSNNVNLEEKLMAYLKQSKSLDDILGILPMEHHQWLSKELSVRGHADIRDRWSNFKSDSAMMKGEVKSLDDLGGIDLTSANMHLQTQNSGREMKFHVSADMLKQLENAPGFVPVIISIQPVRDLREFLGISQGSINSPNPSF